MPYIILLSWLAFHSTFVKDKIRFLVEGSDDKNCFPVLRESNLSLENTNNNNIIPLLPSDLEWKSYN